MWGKIVWHEKIDEFNLSEKEKNRVEHMLLSGQGNFAMLAMQLGGNKATVYNVDDRNVVCTIEPSSHFQEVHFELPWVAYVDDNGKIKSNGKKLVMEIMEELGEQAHAELTTDIIRIRTMLDEINAAKRGTNGTAKKRGPSDTTISA
ncbi:MAG: hypothetical protein ABSC55_10285 [Syntrophorhabdales bacterium]